MTRANLGDIIDRDIVGAKDLQRFNRNSSLHYDLVPVKHQPPDTDAKGDIRATVEGFSISSFIAKAW